MSAPRKATTPRCSHCNARCEREVYEDTHRMRGCGVDARLTFCSLEHKLEFYFDAHCKDRVEDKIRKELLLLHAKVCPACKRRFAELI